jgi:farnesyl diphosphate synthase
VGLIAINDGILLDSHIYRILKRHFRSLPIYIDLVELFHEVRPIFPSFLPFE